MARLQPAWGLAVEASASFLLLVEIVARSATKIPGRVSSGATGRGRVSQLVDGDHSKSVVERVAVGRPAAGDCWNAASDGNIFRRAGNLPRTDKRLCSRYGPRARRVLFLSATPVEKSYRHLWNQLHTRETSDCRH